MEIFTIGTSGRSAKSFFDALEEVKVTSVIDTRRHPNSQLLGYSKSESLSYFCRKILSAQYIHELELAPSEKILKSYKAGELDWPTYSKLYLERIRAIDFSKINFESWGARPVLVCSESLPENCHRSLAAKHLEDTFDFIRVSEHLI